MGHQYRGPDFAVGVEGAFVAPGLWFIHADIEYEVHLGTVARERVRPEAQIELMRGVIAEARHGWNLGARSVRVFVEGDRQVAGLFEVLDRHSVPALVS